MTRWMKALLITGLLLGFAAAGYSQNGNFKYVGSKSCKMCHMTKKSGAQYKIWQKTKHANAFAALATPKAKEIAKKKGIADPQKADECLQCHVTAHGVDAKKLGPKYTVEEGVGCEACHGPGSAYKPKKVMLAISKGEMDGAKVGLVKPTEETCKKCHNEKSPTFTGFNFKEMYAKIKHERPKAK